MFSHAFHHRIGAGVADCKTLTCHTAYIGSTAGCTVECHISCNDIFFCLIIPLFRRIQHDFSSGEAFSHVVITVAAQRQGKPLWYKGPKALSSRTRTGNCNGILRQSLSVLSGDLCAQNGAKRPVCVSHLNLHAGFLTLFHCSSQLPEQHLFILCLLQPEVIYLRRIKSDFTIFSRIGII